MQRIMVIGASGGGKSTLAGRLANGLGLPLHHLDSIHWQAGWIEMDRRQRDQRFLEIYSQDQWVIDGSYSSTWRQRAARADVVLWLRIPAWKRVLRVLLRSWRYRGQSRPDMGVDCPERFNWDTLSFLWFVATSAKSHPAKVAELVAPTGVQILEFRTNQQADYWADSLVTKKAGSVPGL